MFRKLFQKLKKALKFLLVLVVIFLLVITIINFRDFLKDGESISLIIDSGSGSEPGKIFAVTRALACEEIEVTGITSSQWNSHPDAPEYSVYTSHELHETVLQFINRLDIPIFKGAEYPYSIDPSKKGSLSEASEFYIRQANQVRRGDKINIAILGAMTNLAYAISADPSIAGKIRVYCTAFTYNTKAKVWNKNETNVRYDLDAADLLLNTPDLEMHILPSDLAGNFIFSRKEIFDLLEGKGEPWNFLSGHWKRPYHLYPELNMADLALIETLANQKNSKTSLVNTPPENYRRKVNVYTYLNKNMMKSAFLKDMEKEIRR